MLGNNSPLATNTQQSSAPAKASVPAGGALPLAMKALPSAVSALGIGVSAWQNNRNNKIALRNAQLNRQWSLDDRNHYDEYNSAVAQLQRLRAAGVNPLLSSGAANLTGGDTVMPANSAPEFAPQSDLGSSILNAGTNVYQAAIQDKDLRLRQDQLKLQKDHYELDKERLSMDKLNSEVERRLKEAGIKLTEAQTIQVQNNAALVQKQVDTYDERFQKEMANLDQDTAYRKAQTETENLLRKYKKELLEAQIKNTMANTALTYEQKKQVIAATKKTYQEIEANLPKLQAQLMTHQITKEQYAAEVAKLTYKSTADRINAENKTATMEAKDKAADIETYWNEDDNTFGLLRTMGVFTESTVGKVFSGLVNVGGK